MNRKHSIETLCIACLTPALLLGQTFLSGVIISMFISLLMTLLVSSVYLLKSFVPHAQKWLFVTLLSAMLTAVLIRLLAAYWPDYLLSTRFYLSILAFVPLCFLLPARLSFQQNFQQAMSTIFRLMFILFASVGLFSLSREILGTGSVFSDSVLLTGQDFSIGFSSVSSAFFSSTAGGLLLAGLLLAAVRSRHSNHSSG